MTLLTLISSRTKVICLGSSHPLRSMVMVTSVPGSPRILDTAVVKDMFMADSSPISTIWSPLRSPAFSAGVSSMTDTMVTTPLRLEITIPSPPNLPSVSIIMSAYALGDKNDECSSRGSSIPLMAAYSTSSVFTSFDRLSATNSNMSFRRQLTLNKVSTSSAAKLLVFTPILTSISFTSSGSSASGIIIMSGINPSAPRRAPSSIGNGFRRSGTT